MTPFARAAHGRPCRRGPGVAASTSGVNSIAAEQAGVAHLGDASVELAHRRDGVGDHRLQLGDAVDEALALDDVEVRDAPPRSTPRGRVYV